MVNGIELTVASALVTDDGRGIARVDSKARKLLGVVSGDVLEIKGKRRSTAAIVMSAHPQDEGLDFIRIDGWIRQNIGVGIGDRVFATKAEIKNAEKVILAPPPNQRTPISPDFHEYAKNKLEDKPLVRGDVVPIPMFGYVFNFVVAQVTPHGVVRVTKETDVVVRAEPMSESMVKIGDVHYEDIGGLKTEIQKIREMVELPIRYPELFERLGIEPPRGVLLYGSPGTGKTLLAKAVANESDAHFIDISGPELVSKFVGESEEKLREIFNEAKEKAPTVIFMDEIDAIAPKREEATNEVERRMVSQLLALLDGMGSRGQVIVIGASVTGNTQILVKDREGNIRLTPIGPFVDSFYAEGEGDGEKGADGYQVLGFQPKRSARASFSKYTFFGGSKFQQFRSVFRHKVDSVFEIKYVGGTIRATGNHSVFVRTMHGVEPKRVDELAAGDILVDIPFKANRTNRELREMRSHTLAAKAPPKFELYDSKIANAYNSAMILQDTYGPGGKSHLIALNAGVDASTVQRWRHNGTVPDTVRWTHEGIPTSVTLTPNLSRLFGYYAAEGSSKDKEVTFTFNQNEHEYIDDVKSLMRSIFNVSPSIERVHKNACSLYYERAPVASLFGKHIGKRAHEKHLPGFFFEMPTEYFMEFLTGEARGDGYNNPKSGRLEITSVSREFISQMNWCCRMHGIKTSVSTFRVPAGRVIDGYTIEKETIAHRLIFGKTNNPFAVVPTIKPLAQKRAVIKSISAVPFDGYVYDICGAEGEAFFGGDSPVLLHNTNRPNSIDPALRRPGRFDREIEIGVPDRNARKEILQIHTRNMPLKDVNLDELADLTHGYTGADLTALAREAAMCTLRTILPTIMDKKSIPNEILINLNVTRADFINAFNGIQPSALREVFVERPNVHWDDVGGLGSVKGQLKEAVELPIKNPQAFEKMGIRPVKGILLVGAPGTGKTLLAKAVATERESNFISIKGPELLSKFVGESEKATREIFRKARMAAPCIIFIDEIDSIAGTRDGGRGDSMVTERIVDTLLTELDGLQDMKSVFVLAATNRPDMVDPALLRPGRFDKIIEIPMPDDDTRLAIFKVHTKKMPLSKEVDLAELVGMADSYTGAEIENVCREAGMNAIRLGRTSVTKEDFAMAFKEVRPAIPRALAERIKKFKNEPESMYR